jgi:hypothetical protein
MADIKELAKLSYDRKLAQKNLEEKQMARLLLAYNSGLWKVDPTLIALLQSYQTQSDIILLDSNNIPRKVNPVELLKLVQQRHQEVLNDWLIEYNKLAKIRTINHVLE